MINIVLVGNGFDLAHGLKTTYNNFIEAHKESLSFKLDIHNQLYKKVDLHHNGKFRYEPLGHLMRSFENKLDPFWSDLEVSYFSFLMKHKDPEAINSELWKIKSLLFQYLIDEEKNKEFIEAYNYIFKMLRRHGKTIVINFNYTSTLDLYKDHVDEIIHIHGELMNHSNNPIIFGYAANEDDTLELLNKSDNQFLLNRKQYEYLSSNNFERIVAILKESSEKNVFLMGHSCGPSDSLILNKIFNDSSVNNIFNFYHEGIYDHKIKLIDLNRTTSEDIGFDKFKPFPRCLPMPQYDSDYDLSSIEEFMEVNKELLIDSSTYVD